MCSNEKLLALLDEMREADNRAWAQIEESLARMQAELVRLNTAWGELDKQKGNNEKSNDGGN